MSEIKINYPVLGYAPGNYMCTCANCKTTFQGDKRAVQCELCALRIHYSEVETLLKETREQLQQKGEYIAKYRELMGRMATRIEGFIGVLKESNLNESAEYLERTLTDYKKLEG